MPTLIDRVNSAPRLEELALDATEPQTLIDTGGAPVLATPAVATFVGAKVAGAFRETVRATARQSRGAHQRFRAVRQRSKPL